MQNRNCQIGVHGQAPGGARAPVPHSWQRQWIDPTQIEISVFARVSILVDNTIQYCMLCTIHYAASFMTPCV